MKVTQLDDEWTQTKNLNVRCLGRRVNQYGTHRYDVRLRSNGARIGGIRWGNKRVGYSFFPLDSLNENYHFEADAIALYLTAEWRKLHPVVFKALTFKQSRERRLRALLKRPDGGGLDKRYAPVVK